MGGRALRFVTAAFGADYVRAATALRRSFDVAMPDAELVVYSDDATVASPDCTITMQEALEGTEPFDPAGGRRCTVFSFGLLRRQHELHGEDACWIDADMIVLADLRPHFRPGVPNFMCHGRRGGPHFPISGMYSLPPGPIAGHLIGEARSRHDQHPSGDQIVIQKYARACPPIHWLTDDTTRIYNMELGKGLHPHVGDKNLKRIKQRPDGAWELDNRTIMLVCFTMHRLREHLADNFKSFTPPLASLLREFHAAA